MFSFLAVCESSGCITTPPVSDCQVLRLAVICSCSRSHDGCSVRRKVSGFWSRVARSVLHAGNRSGFDPRILFAWHPLPLLKSALLLLPFEFFSFQEFYIEVVV